MAQFLRIMLFLHIISGFAALATGLLSMLNRKGSQRHRITGKVFFAGMTGVFITSIIISVVKQLAFLFMVGFFSYYLACAGYRALYLKKLHLKQRPSVLDWVISSTGVLFGGGLIVFSFTWFAARGLWGLVPLSFGVFCLMQGFQDIRSYFVPPAKKHHWLTNHGLRMGGSFAATVTAFTVVNFSLGAYTWALWILPGVIIGTWAGRLVRGYLGGGAKASS